MACANKIAVSTNNLSARQFGFMVKNNNQRMNSIFAIPQVRNFSAKPDMILMENADEWDAYLLSPTPIILQAGASWCGPCNMLKPKLTEASKTFGESVDYVYMDIDKFPEIAEMLEIQHIPKTFMIYKGELVDQFGGVPQDDQKVTQFFQKAQDLADEKSE